MLIKKWNKTRKVFVWYVRLINEHGKKEFYSPGHTSKKVAGQYEAKLKNEIAERKMFPGRFFPRIKFSDLAEEYLKKHAARTRSYPDYWSIANKLKKTFGDLYIRKIGRHEIESYQAERSTQVGACMVNREIIIMKGMYTKAIDWGYTDKNPVKGIKLAKEKERTRFVNGYERTKLLQAAGAKGRPWYLKSGIIIDLFTGLRKSELLRVTWPDINLERNELHVVEGKGGEGRVVPINTAAREEILKLAKKAKGKYLFHDGHGRPIADIRKAFDQAVKKAGLENVHFHDLRRTFGTECVLKGVPAKTLQKWMGHKSIKTTMKYYVSIPDAYEQEAIKRLDGMVSGSLSGLDAGMKACRPVKPFVAGQGCVTPRRTPGKMRF